mmetsp:Transcript_45703/g.73150  ORF Transcript_45703/g.73150 Transcript_45703/m.73150 type:complete len:293 (+) Transcript_45703:120-998(+)
MSFRAKGFKCICGAQLDKLSANKRCQFVDVVVCDGCLREIDPAKDIWVYHCATRNAAHPNHYDLCAECASKNDEAPSNAAFMALRQQGYDFETTVNALRKSGGDLAKAMQMLQPETHGNDEQQHNSQTLQDQLDKAKEAGKRYQRECRMLRQKNTELTNQVTRLLDEKKEMELMIESLKKENEELKKKNLDETQFRQWNHEEILCWILSIDDAYFSQYSDVLSKELMNCQLLGADLPDLSNKDIRDLGVRLFSDAKKLEKHIQRLVQENSPAQKSKSAYPENEGFAAPTAFI